MMKAKVAAKPVAKKPEVVQPVKTIVIRLPKNYTATDDGYIIR